jgi:hypothetical protein
MDLQETSYSPEEKNSVCQIQGFKSAGTVYLTRNIMPRPCTYATFLIPQDEKIVFKVNKYL